MRVAARHGKYLPGLDGWRAVAITAVLFSHAQPAGAYFRHLQGRGYFGVWLFFSISGFLICSRMLEEESLRGRVSLRSFYIRRAFRILPPAMVYLLALLILNASGVLPDVFSAWLAALLFYRNYWAWFFGATPQTWFTGQFWSLSIEEHFYLILPALVVFLPKVRQKVVLGLAVLSFGFLAFSLLKSAAAIHEFTEQRTECCLSALLLGASAALALQSDSFRQKATKFFRPSVAILAFVLIVGNVFTKVPLGPQTLLLIATRSLLGPVVLLGTVLHPTSYLTRLMETSPLRFIGRISYSLYLWQQIFLTFTFRYPGPIRHLQHPVIGIACSLVCAIASYYLLETPLIRFGRRFVDRRQAVPLPAVTTAGSPS